MAEQRRDPRRPSDGWTDRIRRPSCSRLKATSGRAIASRFTASRQAAYSARGERRNLRRAGTLSNSPSTRTRVPGGSAAGPSPAFTPWSTVDPPAVAPRARLSSVSRDDAGDRRQRLAAKAEAGHRLDRVVGQLGGRVPLERQAHLGRASSRSRRRSLRPVRARPPTAESRPISAPASSAFSTSSFKALAGRSTTSPAAMRLMSSDGSLLIDMLTVLAQSEAPCEALIFPIEIHAAFTRAWIRNREAGRLAWRPNFQHQGERRVKHVLDTLVQMDVARHGDRPRDGQYAGLCPRSRHRPQRAVGGRDRDDQRGQEGQGGRRRRQADDGQDPRPDRGDPPASRRRHRRHRCRRADDQALHPQGPWRQDARLALPGNRDLRAVGIDFGRAPRDPRRRVQRRRFARST